MKKIAIVFRNNQNINAIKSIEETISDMFSEYAKSTTYYMDDMDEVQSIDADIFVVNGRNSVPILRKYADIFGKLILMERNISRRNFEIISKIPQMSDVLVVNDTLESSRETVELLQNLGFTELNFTAFNPADRDNEFYSNFKYAITPDEEQLVPKGIRNILNVGYRKLGFSTIIQLKEALGINDEKLDYKLLKYVSTVMEPVADFRNNFINSYLKSRMLNEFVLDSPSGLVLVNSQKQVIYCNSKAERIFGKSKDKSTINLDSLGHEFDEILQGESRIMQKPISAQAITYIVDKKPITIGEMEIGHLISLQDEIAIKEMERKLSSKLVQKGHFARYTFNDIKGVSTALEECTNIAKKAAKTDYTLLICGESGTGKELFAQAIHNYSTRRDEPFIGVNCAAIPENLLESELFGYEGGAFTGANKNGKLGYFEYANHGTIFLDEIGDISRGIQTKLLRVLQERQIMRIGGDKVIDIDVRIIAATNKNLKAEVENGNFRNDLYYRLNAIQINVPPLRERTRDIPLLIKAYMGVGEGVTDDEMLRLQSYDWPGNVRELENCVLYYKTLGKLPEQFYEGEKEIKTVEDPVGVRLTEENISLKVLQMIASEKSISHGVGRMAILKRLKANGIGLSDVRLRAIMGSLSEKGYILVGKGRKGTEITEKGLEFLKEAEV